METVMAAYAAAKPYLSVFSAVSSIASGVQSWQQGLYAASASRLKAKQTQLEADVKALNARQQGVELAKKQQRVAASLLARGAAGNIDPFSGSAAVVAQYNESNLGADLMNLRVQEQRFKTFGEIQAQILNDSADYYESSGFAGFLKGLGSAAYIMGETFVPGDPEAVSTVDGYRGYETQTQLYGSEYSDLYGGNAALPDYDIGPDFRNVSPSYQSYGAPY